MEKEKMNLQEATLKALYDQLNDSKDVDDVEGLVDNILVVTDPKINTEEYEEVIERAQEIVEDTPEGEIPFDEEWEGQYLQTCPICGATFVTDEILEPGAICPVCTQVPEAFVMVGRVETDEQVAKENNIDMESENEEENIEGTEFKPETFEDEDEEEIEEPNEEEKVEASEEVKSSENKLEENKEIKEEGFFNLYKDYRDLYGIDKYTPEQLLKFLDGMKDVNRISDKEYKILTKFANDYQALIDNCGYESSIVESKELDEEVEVEAEVAEPETKANYYDLKDLRAASDTLQTLWDTIEGGESEYLGQFKSDIAEASDIIDKILQKAELSNMEVAELDESKKIEESTDEEIDAFDKQLEEAGITTTNKLYYVTRTPKDCHTIEEADNWYRSDEGKKKWGYSYTCWEKDKADITPEQYKLIDDNRELAEDILIRAWQHVNSYGHLD